MSIKTVCIMKTPVLRKKIKNVIIDPYDFSRTFNDLSPFGIIENYSIISDGHLRYSVPDYEDSPNETDEDRKKKIDANTVDTYIFKIPAYFASLDLDSKYLLNFNGFAYYDKSVLKLFNKPSQKNSKGIDIYTTLTNNSEETALHYYFFNLGYCSGKEIKNKVEINRVFFNNINDYVFLLVSFKRRYRLTLKYSTFPINQPFFWDKPIATSIFDNQTIQESKILLGTVKSIVRIDKVSSLRSSYPKYAEKTYKVDYSWDESAGDDTFCLKNNDSFCTINMKSVICSIPGENYVNSIMLPVYVYKRDCIANNISAFVWHSGNEDDMVRKSRLGYKEEDEAFYKDYKYLRESLSLETIYGSFASLTKLSELNAAKYIVRTLAHQPKGNRCVSIEGHLQYLIGGALYHIQEIINQSRKKGEEILTDEDYNRVNRLFQINGSHLFYDTIIDFTGIDKNDVDRIFLEKILGLKEGSNGCSRLSTLLDKIFHHVSRMGIGVDYIYCDIENVNNDARSLAVHRFNTRYQYKYESKNVKDTLEHKIYGVLEKDINDYKSSEIKDSLLSLGYYKNGNGYVDIASVSTEDDSIGLYGISNGKSYVQRRNVNVWDVVMKNYTNKLFYNHIFKPILNTLGRPLKGFLNTLKCSADSRYYSKGYLNRAERYETYLGGSLKLPSGLYSSIPLYGDHMTKGYIKPNMDNWKILLKPTLFSCFMDHINRLRVTALSSPQNHFNVFVPSWNLWAFDINKIREFRVYNDKGEIIKHNELEERKAIAYHKELLYHTFLMNPDKAIAYFSLDSTVEDKTHYINLDAEEADGYFKYAYDKLNQILEDVNNRLGMNTIIPQTKTLAVETEPYVLSCAEVNTKWIWRLTVNEEITPKVERTTISFIVGGRKIVFFQVENNPLENINSNKIGFWIVTPVGVKPQITSENDYYFKNPATEFSMEEIEDEIQKEKSKFLVKNSSGIKYKPFSCYTLFGEAPQIYSTSMRFSIENQSKNNEVYLLWGEKFTYPECNDSNSNAYNSTKRVIAKIKIDENSKILFEIAGTSIEQIEDFPSKGELAKNTTYEIKLYAYIDNLLNGKISGSIRYELYSNAGEILYAAKSKIAYTSNNILPYLSSEFYIEKYSSESKNEIIKIEEFRLFFSGHQEKVELFRKSNGLNITRVNKEIEAYKDIQLEESFTDFVIAKFSWLNAENKPVKYRLTFTLKKENSELLLSNIVRPSSRSGNRLVYSEDGSLTIHEVTDKQIVLEVAPNSEGYMLFQITKNPVTITSASCSCVEVKNEINPDTVYHVM